MHKTVGASIILASFLALTSVTSVKADRLNWHKFAQYSGGLAAIAAGLAMAGACKVPYQFEQQRDGKAMLVFIHCKDTGDPDFKGMGHSVIIRFEQVPGSKRLIPHSFQLAG